MMDMMIKTSENCVLFLVDIKVVIKYKEKIIFAIDLFNNGNELNLGKIVEKYILGEN